MMSTLRRIRSEIQPDFTTRAAPRCSAREGQRLGPRAASSRRNLDVVHHGAFGKAAGAGADAVAAAGAGEGEAGDRKVREDEDAVIADGQAVHCVVDDLDRDGRAVAVGIRRAEGEMHAIHPDVDADVLIGGAIGEGVGTDGETVGCGGAGFTPCGGTEVPDGKARAVRGRARARGELEIEAGGEAGERRGGGETIEDDRADSARDFVSQLDATVSTAEPRKVALPSPRKSFRYASVER